jgi:cytochrome P450
MAVVPPPSSDPVRVGGWAIPGLWRRLRRNPPEGFRHVAAYGDLVEVSLGVRRLVVVNHPTYIESVLVDQQRAFIKGRSLRLARPVLGDGLLTSEGDVWRRHRRLAQPAFLRARVAAYAPAMLAVTERHLRRWAVGDRLDLAREMTRLTLAIATETLFGVDIGEAADQVHADLTRLMRGLNAQVQRVVPWPAWWPSPARRAERAALARLDAVIYRIMADRRRRGVTGDDLLGRLMAALDDEAEALTPTELRDEIMTLLVAGHETTANALAWTFYLLARHPESAERLRAELVTTLGDRPVTPADAERLPYTRAVIQEALRLYPPAWIMVREAIRPVTFGAHTWPAGTQVIVSQWVTHRDRRFFGDDADRFRPERWLGDGPPVPRYAYFPFGGGPRLCIGRPFALLEALLIVATIHRRVRFRLLDAPPVTVEALVTLRPRHGIPVTITDMSAAPPPRTHGV